MEDITVAVIIVGLLCFGLGFIAGVFYDIPSEDDDE